jgi:hypothetical protein
MFIYVLSLCARKSHAQYAILHTHIVNNGAFDRVTLHATESLADAAAVTSAVAAADNNGLAGAGGRGTVSFKLKSLGSLADLGRCVSAFSVFSLLYTLLSLSLLHLHHRSRSN